jgi:hypothetical protein
VFLPTAVLVCLPVALASSGAVTSTPQFSRFPVLVDSLGIIELLALAALVLLLSLILQPFQVSLVQLLEGYWGTTWIGAALNDIGVERHRRRWVHLQQIARSEAITAEARRARAVAEALLVRYPMTESRLLPTQLGNALRAAEDRAGQRYGLATVTVWPRLYPYLSEPLARTLDGVRDQLDAAARLCVVLMVATLVSAAMLLTDGWWLLVPAATAVLSLLSYRSAIQAAIAYGEAMHWAFDLHRFDMLRALHYRLPTSMEEELKFNKQLSVFFAENQPIGGKPATHVYTHPDDLGEESPDDQPAVVTVPRPRASA